MRKLSAMLENRPATDSKDSHSLFAWPEKILIDDEEECCGFVMSEAREVIPLVCYTFHNEQMSAHHQSLKYRLAICANLARGMQELHDRGHLLVDFKPQNVLVYPETGDLCFVDCDGFGIFSPSSLTFFPAREITPGYAAPELIGARERTPRNSAEQQPDRFTLAVIIFELLARIHPFDVVLVDEDDKRTSRESRVAARMYPYGRRKSPELEPPDDSEYECLPNGLRRMLDDGLSGLPVTRPKAQEWVQALEAHQQELVTCPLGKSNSVHLHFQGRPCPECLRKERENELLRGIEHEITLPPRDTPLTSSRVHPIHEPRRALKSTPTVTPGASERKASGARQWLPVLLAVLAVIGFIWFLSTGGMSTQETAATDVAPADAAAPYEIPADAAAAASAADAYEPEPVPAEESSAPDAIPAEVPPPPAEPPEAPPPRRHRVTNDLAGSVLRTCWTNECGYSPDDEFRNEFLRLANNACRKWSPSARLLGSNPTPGADMECNVAQCTITMTAGVCVAEVIDSP